MSSSHQEQYFGKLIVGFASLMGSVFLTFFAFFEGAKKGDWYWWAVGVAFLLCGGVYFCLTAFVHKIKSEFSRRQRQREAQKSVISGE